MEIIDRVGSPTSCLELHETEESYEIQSSSYRLRFDATSPYISLSDARGTPWMQIFKGGNVVTSAQSDAVFAFEPPQCEVAADGSIVVRIASQGEGGSHKEQVWVCRDAFIETFMVAESIGDLKQINLLGGTFVAPNMFGESMSERYFNGVYNPQPSEMERPAISALESTRITTSGMWKPGRRREFLITPFAYGFSLSQPYPNGLPPAGDWLMASISAPIEEQNMTDFQYEAREDGFMFRMIYDSTAPDGTTFTSPSLLLHFAPDPLTGLRDAKDHAEAIGHLKAMPKPLSADWHTGTTFVTWGHQLEEERRQRENGAAVKAAAVLSEPFVIGALETLNSHGINPKKLVLDDKWQAEYGTNTPDPEKWPNMARFTHMQHELGRYVLLWVKLFDPEGLPPELCIVNDEGYPIASDPTNPAYLDLLRDQVHAMLAPDHLNADGLKLDFIAQLPHGPGLRWHGKARGPAALHNLMEAISTAATVKKNALIEAQVVNPWFADVMNQVRLNDANTRHSLVRTMGQRAKLAAALLPDHSIDPDGWPVKDIDSWREYIQAQPDMAGTVTTHFVDTINGEPLTTNDYEVVVNAIQSLNARKSGQMPLTVIVPGAIVTT